jgi:hypothetical protein
MDNQSEIKENTKKYSSPKHLVYEYGKCTWAQYPILKSMPQPCTRSFYIIPPITVRIYEA